MVNFNNMDLKAMFIVFIGAIIALTLIFVISDSIFTETNTITIDSANVTALAPNVTLDVEGRELLTTTRIANSSNLSQLLEGNGGLLQTGVGSSGLLSVQLLLNDTASAFEGEEITISYTANPDGYVSDTGGRAITNLILIFAALGIMVFVIAAFAKDGTLGKFLRGEK